MPMPTGQNSSAYRSPGYCTIYGRALRIRPDLRDSNSGDLEFRSFASILTENLSSATCFSDAPSRCSAPSTSLWDEHAKSDDEEEMRRFRNGEDLRYLPLIDRKRRLHAVMPKRSERLLAALAKYVAQISKQQGRYAVGHRIFRFRS